jgi:hypothetical protein
VVAAIVAIAAVIVDNLGLSQYTTEIKLSHNFLHLAYLYDNVVQFAIMQIITDMRHLQANNDNNRA